jgi:hypothetical protein
MLNGFSTFKSPLVKPSSGVGFGWVFGVFPFPEGEGPSGMNLGSRELKPVIVPLPEFMKLTKIPIVIYYDVFIPDKTSTNPGQEQWRIFFEVAKRWRDTVNK